MTFPGDKTTSRQDPQNQPAIVKQCDRSNGQAADTSFINSDSDQKPEVTKYQSTGANMIGRSAEQPHASAAYDQYQQSGFVKYPETTQGHKESHKEKRCRVHSQMLKTTMQERPKYYARQGADLSRVYTKSVQRMTEVAVDEFNHPN